MTEAPEQERDERVVPDHGQLESAARALLAMLDRMEWKLATAESCTGGFLSSLLTDVEGLSHCLDRGYVCYSVAAKHDMLGIDPGLIDEQGAVSEPVARARRVQPLPCRRAAFARHYRLCGSVRP